MSRPVRLARPAAAAPIAVSEPALLLESVRCAARLRLDWLAQLADRVEAVAQDRDDPTLEAAWRAGQPDAARLRDLGQELDAIDGRRLRKLQSQFGLDARETDILQVCVAVDLDPDLALLFEAISGERLVTGSLVARLFDHGRLAQLGPSSPLLRWGLVSVQRASSANQVFALDPALRAWISGDTELDPILAPHAHVPAVLAPLAAWPVPSLSGTLGETLRGGEQTRLVLVGADGSGRKTLAAALAASLGFALVSFNVDQIDAADWPGFFMRAQRQAFLDRCAIAWQGESLERRPWNHDAAFPLEFLIAEPGQTLPSCGGIERRYALPMLTAADRRALWLQHVRQAAAWPAETLDDLASRYHALPGDIVRIARRRPGNASDCMVALRANIPAGIRELGELLEGSFDWNDLVVPSTLRLQLEDFAYEARTRGGFWEKAEARRLFPQGRGLIALLSGPPGTGKTMAAQVVAGELGLTLCKVNLSQILSKWVGESAQRLERLFTLARQRPMALLFDEADAIYGKRVTETSTAQDRFANMDVSHLMMAIEGFDGIVLLTTNLKSNIDPAFLRRIRYSLEFAKPDFDDRVAIWIKVVAGLQGARRAQALAKAWPKLATIEATGAQIKNAVLSASFIAARAGEPVALAHLLAGLNREFAKEGYALSNRQIAELSDG